MRTIATVFAFLLMLAGLLGTLAPVVPDTPLILVGALVLALADGFTLADLKLLAVLALIAVIAEALSYLAVALGAKGGGASWKGIAGAILGVVAGLVILGPWGLLIGPAVGVILGEMWAGKRGKDAIKAGLGALVGVIGGVVLKFAAGVTMIGCAIMAHLTK
jgi:hypothetical protein